MRRAVMPTQVQTTYPMGHDTLCPRSISGGLNRSTHHPVMGACGEIGKEARTWR